MTLVGAQGADRVTHMGSVQCGVPDIIFYLSRVLPSPTELFREMVVEIYMLQRFDSTGYL